jgi:hypothetical protein
LPAHKLQYNVFKSDNSGNKTDFLSLTFLYISRKEEPVLQEGFPTAGNWRKRKARAKGERVACPEDSPEGVSRQQATGVEKTQSFS